MESRRFFLLGGLCAQEEVESMMGRVVRDRLWPLQDAYAPFEPLDSSEAQHNTQDILPRILPKPELSTNRKEIIQSTQKHGVRAELTSLFGFELNWSDKQRAQLESAEVKRYMLKNPERFWDRLRENAAYKKDVTELLNKCHWKKGYFVTGFMTAVGLLRKTTQKRVQSISGDITAPVSATLLGTPTPLDPSLGMDKSNEIFNSSKWHASGEQIFAVSYYTVQLTRSLDRNAKHYVSKEAEFGGPARGKKHHLMLGEGEGEDEVELESDDDPSDEKKEYLSDLFDDDKDAGNGLSFYVSV